MEICDNGRGTAEGVTCKSRERLLVMREDEPAEFWESESDLQEYVVVKRMGTPKTAKVGTIDELWGVLDSRGPVAGRRDCQCGCLFL